MNWFKKSRNGKYRADFYFVLYEIDTKNNRSILDMYVFKKKKEIIIFIELFIELLLSFFKNVIDIINRYYFLL